MWCPLFRIVQFCHESFSFVAYNDNVFARCSEYNGEDDDSDATSHNNDDGRQPRRQGSDVHCVWCHTRRCTGQIHSHRNDTSLGKYVALLSI